MQAFLDSLISENDPLSRNALADYLEEISDDRGRFWRDEKEVDKITILNSYQQHLMSVWRDKWIEIGLSTHKGFNKPLIENNLRKVYSVAGLDSPTVFVYLNSPLQGMIGAELLSQVWSQVRSQVRSQVDSQVWSQVESQVGSQVRSQVWSQVYKCGYGCHDAGWLAYYSYLLHVCNLNVCNKLVPTMNLSSLIGWWWPFTNAVVITPKPSKLIWNNSDLVGCWYADDWGFNRK